jgi:hypothetical protein
VLSYDKTRCPMAPVRSFQQLLTLAPTGYTTQMESYEVVVRGRLSEALIRGTCTELIDCRAGRSRLLASDFDQFRLHTLFELFRDLNIELVSVNPTMDLVRG